MGMNEWIMGRKKDQESQNTVLAFDIQFSSLAQLYIFRNSARTWKLLDTQKRDLCCLRKL